MKKNFWAGLESVMGAIVAVAIVIVSVTVIYPQSRNEKGDSSINSKNMNEMKAIGYDYFKDNNTLIYHLADSLYMSAYISPFH